MQRDDASDGVVSVRTMEIITAACLIAVGMAVMWDSYRVGIAWADDGPQAGYFPFYVGLIIVASSAVTLLANLLRRGVRQVFVEREQLRLVLRVLIPTAVFVAAIGWIGIYVAMGLFIAVFMTWLGRFPLYKVLPVAILVPLALFFMFEVWFLVPLPKGPIEAWLGY